MSETTSTLDIKLQICFGIFAVLSLIVAFASLHARDSLGVVWFRCMRRRVQRTFTHGGFWVNDGFTTTDTYRDEEGSIGLTRLDSISIPSSRLSFDEDTVMHSEHAVTGMGSATLLAL